MCSLSTSTFFKIVVLSFFLQIIGSIFIFLLFKLKLFLIEVFSMLSETEVRNYFLTSFSFFLSALKFCSPIFHNVFSCSQNEVTEPLDDAGNDVTIILF